MRDGLKERERGGGGGREKWVESLKKTQPRLQVINLSAYNAQAVIGVHCRNQQSIEKPSLASTRFMVSATCAIIMRHVSSTLLRFTWDAAKRGNDVSLYYKWFACLNGHKAFSKPYRPALDGYRWVFKTSSRYRWYNAPIWSMLFKIQYGDLEIPPLACNNFYALAQTSS